MIMKQKAILIIALIALVLMMITPASAETLTGTLGSSGITSTIYNTTTFATDETTTITYLKVTNIENTENPFSIVRFMNHANLDGFDVGAPPTVSTSVTLRLDTIAGAIIGTGTLGYQRTYDVATPPIETPYGFEYLIFNSWNVTGLTGTKNIYLDYDRSDLYNASIAKTNNPPSEPVNWIGFGGTTGTYPVLFSDGQLVFNRYVDVWSSYTATKPSGLNIAGSVVKTTGGASFNSRIFITNATDGVITSDTTSNPNTFNFTVIDNQIKIKMLAPSGTWYNSSILFAAAVPTVTPTSTPLPQESPYILTLSPGAIAIGGNVTATLSSITDPTLALISGIDYWYSGPDNVLKVFHEPTNYDLVKQYQLYNVTWYQFNVSTGDFTKALGSIPNPNTLRFVDSGTKTVRCNVFLKTGQYYVITGIVIVGQGGDYITTSFQSYDGTNYGFLTWTEIDIYNHNTQTWLNGTYSTGKATISTPPNTLLSAYGTKAGYYLAKYENTPASSIPYSLVFYQIGATPIIGTQLFRVNVIDTNGVRVVGAAVKAVESGTTNITYGSTSASGVATLTLITSTNYIISASKTGYIGTSKSITTDTGLSGSTILTLTVPTTTVTSGVRTDTEKATDAFSKWIDVLGDITDIAIGVVIIWLMWITVYMITGGKIIDKIMKRGRK